MKSQHIFFFGIIITIVIIFFYALTDKKTEQSYEGMVQQFRKDKEEFMKNDKKSPFFNSQNKFTHLDYFNPDPNFRIKATITPSESQKTFTIQTSTNESKKMTVFGFINFSRGNKDYKLLAFISEDDNSLFVPFNDSSNGEETYTGGRYLSLEKPDGNNILIDFNLAYNPYCVYNVGYSCPIPPKENTLDFKVLAGEKMWGEPH